MSDSETPAAGGHDDSSIDTDTDHATDGSGRDRDADGDEAVNPDAPPACVRWTDEHHGVIEIETTRAVIEWMDLEAAEHGSDSLADWIRTQLWAAISRDLDRHHGFSAEVEVDVPPDFAERASLWAAHHAAEGEFDSARFEDFILNNMDLDATYLLDGTPWALTRFDWSEDDPTINYDAIGGDGDD